MADRLTVAVRGVQLNLGAAEDNKIEFVERNIEHVLTEYYSSGAFLGSSEFVKVISHIMFLYLLLNNLKFQWI